MKIIHIGAENCVTGSCHLVQARGVTLLVDCGIAQGHDPVLPFEQWPVAAADIDYLFLTHAHIDHIGRVPDLIYAGFKGEIICTHATKALLVPMLRDGMSFSSRTDSQIRAMEARIDYTAWGFEMYDTFQLKNGITFHLKNAGHILGSCFIQFSFPRPGGIPFRVTFSGDLGCTDTPILPDPDLPDTCDLLVLESTYGDRNHEHRAERVQALKLALDHALADSGIVYIPAFSLGRTQELIYELDRINPGVPVFIDSPLGIQITRLYQQMDDFWNREARNLKAAGDHPVKFDHLYAVERFTLAAWVAAMPDPPGEIRLVHGEPRTKTALNQRLKNLS